MTNVSVIHSQEGKYLLSRTLSTFLLLVCLGCVHCISQISQELRVPFLESLILA